MLHVRAATAAATQLRRGSDAPSVALHPQGVSLDAHLPAGTSELVLRALAGGALAGTLELTATPVTPLEEGAGPEVLLAPGATRFFSFAVAREGHVGVGVRASTDVVETALMSADGRRLGEGVVQMPVLAPGTYLLALHAPAAGRPVRARPAVVGLRLPDTGPPEDVLKRYLEPEAEEGGPRTFSATRVEEESEEMLREGGEAEGESTEEGMAPDEEAPAEGEEEVPPEPQARNNLSGRESVFE